MKQNMIGDFEKIYVGHSKDEKIRCKGTSGGVVSSILVDLLKKKKISCALVVGMDKDKPWLPAVKIVSRVEDIIEASGSKYVFISVKDILEVLGKENRKMAIVGLPCHLSVISNLMKTGKYKNVKYLIGLFCGYNMPFTGTDYLIKKSKVKYSQISSLEWRGGKYPGGFLIRLKNGERVFYPKHYYDFVNLMFVRDGCLNCKDYMSEAADVSVGDSWGYPNNSVVIVRNKTGVSMLESVNLNEISFYRLWKMHKHNILHKKKGKTPVFAMKLLRVFGPYVPISILGWLASVRRKFK